MHRMSRNNEPIKANQIVKDMPVSIGRINIDLEPQATFMSTLSYL
jgi:hypothetical protein